MLPRNFSNGKGRSSGASLFLRLAQSASIEEVLEDLREIAAEKGIHLHSVRVKRGRLEREFKPPTAIAVVGRIGELAIGVEGGQTHLVVKFLEPMDGVVMRELEYAAHLAAHRIEILAGGMALTGSAVSGSEDRSVVIDELLGESELMRDVRKNIVIAARLNLSVLIIGEPGTGKELVARGIHKASSRAGKPFVDVNCAAINPNLIESELFGHEKGAFTEALARKLGRFERASGGTLFLDEIGDLSPESQALLLALLREREYENAGWRHALKIDIRLIVATNHDLRPEVAAERFRPDLYDRINEFPISTPPLRKHPTDIPILIQSYFPFIEFDEASMEMLCRYHWPGNVRQLLSTVERLAAKAGGGRIITADHVRREIDLERKSELATAPGDRFPAPRKGETLKEYICRAVLAVYEMERAHLGNHSAAAHRLGMNRTTLYDWLEWARQHVAK